MKRTLVVATLLWLALALAPSRLAAQAVGGTVLGAVKDSSGAAVSNAAVVITAQETGVNRTVFTNAQGEYEAPSLPPGVYAVSVEMPGFKKTTLSNLQLGVDQKLRAEVVLEVGAVTETVQVEGQAPVVKSDSSELGETVTEHQIKDLPLNGRDFVQLTRIIPGVVRGIPGANIDGAGSLAWRASASFSANGQRTRDNNFLLDGIDNNETWLNSVVVFPSIDALEEFKVQTSTYSAEFGRSSGGVVNIQVKSGANAFHGSLFEFLRNDKFDANDFFNNKSGRQKPPFRQNQFGGTYGGRIVRDKTFFFMDYQGWRIRQAQTYLSNVPTDLMKQGNFAELTRVIYDPLTQAPFPSQFIPSSRFDPAAKNILSQLYPAPNVPGQRSAATGQTINNFLFNPSQARNDDQFDVKVDHNLTTNNRAFARYSFQRTERFLPATLPDGDAGFTFGAGTGLVRAQSLAINDTHTFSPHVLNEFRFGFSRFGIKVTSIDAGTNLAQKVGIPGINVADTATAMSQITFAGGDIRNLGANGNQPLLTFLDTFQYYDNVTLIHGRHSIKTGVNFTRRRRNVFNVDNITGTFQFSSNLTSNCAGVTTPGCQINPTTGFSLASFLLGFPISETRTFSPGIVGERKPELGAYVQDDFRVSSRLTLNLGLRYDLFVPFVEQHDRQSNFDTSTGKFVIASDDAVINGLSVGRALQLTPKLDFAPRLGFAYDLRGNGRTLLRAGYGMFYNNPLTGTSSQKPSNPPFLLAQAFTTTLLPTLKLSDGVPPPPAVDPNRPPSGSTRSIFDPRFRDGRAQQWNINIQQQLGRDYLVEVAYAGSRGDHLVIKDDINVAPPVVGVTNSDVNRPYIRVDPLVRGLSQVESRGFSIYHALQTKFSKRFASGVSFVNAFTWGKTIDIVSDTEGATLNPYNFKYDRSVADFDISKNFTSSANYELPFGKGKKFANSGPVADKLLGGWQVNLILLARSGLPFTVTQQQGLLSTGTGNRPNRLGSGRLSNPTPDRWWDLSAFAQTADNTGTYGNSGRNILRQPDQVNTDVSIIKSTRFHERFEHQFRVELFNAVNHPQFGAPGSTLGASNQGVISNLLFNTPMRQIQFAMKLSF